MRQPPTIHCWDHHDPDNGFVRAARAKVTMSPENWANKVAGEMEQYETKCIVPQSLGTTSLLHPGRTGIEFFHHQADAVDDPGEIRVISPYMTNGLATASEYVNSICGSLRSHVGLEAELFWAFDIEQLVTPERHRDTVSLFPAMLEDGRTLSSDKTMREEWELAGEPIYYPERASLSTWNYQWARWYGSLCWREMNWAVEQVYDIVQEHFPSARCMNFRFGTWDGWHAENALLTDRRRAPYSYRHPEYLVVQAASHEHVQGPELYPYVNTNDIPPGQTADQAYAYRVAQDLGNNHQAYGHMTGSDICPWFCPVGVLDCTPSMVSTLFGECRRLGIRELFCWHPPNQGDFEATGRELKNNMQVGARDFNDFA